MSILSPLFGRALAVTVLLGCTSAWAQDSSIDLSLKLRTGIGEDTLQDHLQQNFLGFGLNAAFPLVSGKLDLELGYLYKGGRAYRLTPLPPADAASSVDYRKNTLEGITFRLGYENSISPIIGWQAGIQLHNARFRHEYIQDLVIPATSSEDTQNGTPTKNALVVDPYAGVSFKVNEFSHLEFNAILLSYKSISYSHTPNDTGSNTGDVLAETNRNSLHFEVAYVFHF